MKEEELRNEARGVAAPPATSRYTGEDPPVRMPPPGYDGPSPVVAQANKVEKEAEKDLVKSAKILEIVRGVKAQAGGMSSGRLEKPREVDPAEYSGQTGGPPELGVDGAQPKMMSRASMADKQAGDQTGTTQVPGTGTPPWLMQQGGQAGPRVVHNPGGWVPTTVSQTVQEGVKFGDATLEPLEEAKRHLGEAQIEDERAAYIDGEIGDSTAALMKKRAIAAADLTAKHSQEAQALHQQNISQLDSMSKDIASFKLDPNRAWNKRSSGQKVLSTIAEAMAVFGTALAGRNGSENIVTQKLIREQELDFQAQREEYNSKRARLQDANNLYARNMEIFKDRKLAEIATQSMQFEAMKSEIVKQTAMATSARAKAGGHRMYAELLSRQAQLRGDFDKESQAKAQTTSGQKFIPPSTTVVGGQPELDPETLQKFADEYEKLGIGALEDAAENLSGLLDSKEDVSKLAYNMQSGRWGEVAQIVHSAIGDNPEKYQAAMHAVERMVRAHTGAAAPQQQIDRIVGSMGMQNGPKGLAKYMEIIGRDISNKRVRLFSAFPGYGEQWEQNRHRYRQTPGVQAGTPKGFKPSGQ